MENKTKEGDDRLMTIYATVVETFRKRVRVLVPAEEAEKDEDAAEYIEQACNDGDIDATEDCDDYHREIVDVEVENTKGGK